MGFQNLHSGCEKEIEFTRKRRQMDGELFDQERKISFAIKAGWKAGEFFSAQNFLKTFKLI